MGKRKCGTSGRLFYDLNRLVRVDLREVTLEQILE